MKMKRDKCHKSVAPEWKGNRSKIAELSNREMLSLYHSRCEQRNAIFKRLRADPAAQRAAMVSERKRKEFEALVEQEMAQR